MSTENRCASCGKAFIITDNPVIEGDHAFCDKICRANYHKGKAYTPPPTPKATTSKPLNDNQNKYIFRLIEGGVSILLGLALTWWSKKHDVLKEYYAIFYGPVVWGIIALIWGSIGLWQSKKPPSVLDKYTK